MASKRWSFHLWCGWRFTGSSSCQKGGNCFSPVTPPTVALALRSLGQLFHWPARCRSSNYWGLKVELRNHPPPRGRATQAFLPSRTHQYSAGICILPRQNPNRGLCSNTYLVCQKRLQKDQNLLTKQNGHQFFLCSLCISSFICSPGHMLNNMHVLSILISVTGQDNMYDQQDLIATTSWCTPICTPSKHQQLVAFLSKLVGSPVPVWFSWKMSRLPVVRSVRLQAQGACTYKHLLNHRRLDDGNTWEKVDARKGDPIALGTCGCGFHISLAKGLVLFCLINFVVFSDAFFCEDPPCLGIGIEWPGCIRSRFLQWCLDRSRFPKPCCQTSGFFSKNDPVPTVHATGKPWQTYPCITRMTVCIRVPILLGGHLSSHLFGRFRNMPAWGKMSWNRSSGYINQHGSSHHDPAGCFCPSNSWPKPVSNITPGFWGL